MIRIPWNISAYARLHPRGEFERKISVCSMDMVIEIRNRQVVAAQAWNRRGIQRDEEKSRKNYLPLDHSATHSLGLS